MAVLVFASVVSLMYINSVHFAALASPTTNLAYINDGKWYTDNSWTLCPAENIVLDTAKTYQGNPSWLVEPTSSNCGVDHQRIDISPGETIEMICAIYTSGTASDEYGARIGLDFYGHLGRIGLARFLNFRIGQANDPTDVADEKQQGATGTYDVPYGTDSWTIVTWNFVVPPDYTSDGGGPYPAGELVPITQCIPWCGVWNNNGQNNGLAIANVWFSDFQFYITGTTSSSPKPTSTVSPSPTSSPETTITPTPISTPVPTSTLSSTLIPTLTLTSISGIMLVTTSAKVLEDFGAKGAVENEHATTDSGNRNKGNS